jgi:hypothetical protein
MRQPALCNANFNWGTALRYRLKDGYPKEVTGSSALFEGMVLDR